MSVSWSLNALRWASVCVAVLGVVLATMTIGAAILHALGLSNLLEERQGEPSGVQLAISALSMLAAWRVGDATYHRSWRNGMDAGSRLIIRALMLGCVVFGVLGGLCDYLISDVGENWYTLHVVVMVVSFFGAMAVVRFGTEFGRRRRKIWSASIGTRTTAKLRVCSHGFGDAEKLRWIGEAYLEGERGERDDLEAEYWLRCAAKEGDTKAQIELAKLMAFESQTTRDPMEALKWLNAVSRSGDPSAVSLQRKIFAQLTVQQLERVSHMTNLRDALRFRCGNLLRKVSSMFVSR